MESPHDRSAAGHHGPRYSRAPPASVPCCPPGGPGRLGATRPAWLDLEAPVPPCPCACREPRRPTCGRARRAAYHRPFRLYFALRRAPLLSPRYSGLVKDFFTEESRSLAPAARLPAFPFIRSLFTVRLSLGLPSACVPACRLRRAEVVQRPHKDARANRETRSREGRPRLNFVSFAPSLR